MTNDVRGYYISTLQRIERANRSHIGVKLGLVCVEWNIPVTAVARKFGVTRQTVYSWFLGQRQPSQKMIPRITEYIAELERRSL